MSCIYEKMLNCYWKESCSCNFNFVLFDFLLSFLNELFCENVWMLGGQYLKATNLEESSLSKVMLRKAKWEMPQLEKCLKVSTIVAQVFLFVIKSAKFQWLTFQVGKQEDGEGVA